MHLQDAPTKSYMLYWNCLHEQAAYRITTGFILKQIHKTVGFSFPEYNNHFHLDQTVVVHSLWCCKMGVGWWEGVIPH